MSHWTPALLVLAVLAVAIPVAAQAPAKPAPCAGLTATDAIGDQAIYVPGINQRTELDAPVQTDITGVFFNAEATRMTANLRLTELTKTVPPPFSGLRYTLYYKVGGKGYYVRAIQSGDRVTYTYGTDEGSQALTELGEVPGSFHEGLDGVVQWVLPASTTGRPGQSFTGWAATSVLFQGPNGSPADYIPDGSSAEDGPRFSYRGERCPAGPSQPTTTPTSPGPAPTATPTPSPTPGSSDVLLRVRVSPTLLKLRKVRRASKIAFRLDCEESVTRVTIELRGGSRMLARTRLKSLSGTRNLTMRLKRRGLKKGNYVMVFRAKRSDGSQTGVSHRIKVR